MENKNEEPTPYEKEIIKEINSEFGNMSDIGNRTFIYLCYKQRYLQFYEKKKYFKVKEIIQSIKDKYLNKFGKEEYLYKSLKDIIFNVFNNSIDYFVSISNDKEEELLNYFLSKKFENSHNLIMDFSIENEFDAVSLTTHYAPRDFIERIYYHINNNNEFNDSYIQASTNYYPDFHFLRYKYDDKICQISSDKKITIEIDPIDDNFDIRKPICKILLGIQKAREGSTLTRTPFEEKLLEMIYNSYKKDKIPLEEKDDNGIDAEIQRFIGLELWDLCKINGESVDNAIFKFNSWFLKDGCFEKYFGYKELGIKRKEKSKITNIKELIDVEAYIGKYNSPQENVINDPYFSHKKNYHLAAKCIKQGMYQKNK